MPPRSISILLVSSGLVLAAALAGCGGDAADTGSEPPTNAVAPPTELPPTPDDGGQDAAGGTTMRVYTVTEALAGPTDGSIHVSGLLIDDGSGWRLCGASLESYPPQCGGEALAVEGLDEEGRPIDEAAGVRWQDGATVVGEVSDGALTVTGSPASS